MTGVVCGFSVFSSTSNPKNDKSISTFSLEQSKNNIQVVVEIMEILCGRSRSFNTVFVTIMASSAMTYFWRSAIIRNSTYEFLAKIKYVFCKNVMAIPIKTMFE